MKTVTYKGTTGEPRNNAVFVEDDEGNQHRLDLDAPTRVPDEVADQLGDIEGASFDVADAAGGQTKQELIDRANELDVDVPSGATKDEVAALVAQAEAEAGS